MSTLIHTLTTKNQLNHDSMWIYRNPKGLKILENELEARRKRRTALNHTQYTLKDREGSFNLDSPPPDFFLERNISPLTLSPAQDIHLPVEIEEEKHSNQPEPISSRSTIKESRKPQILQVKPTKSEPRIKRLQETYNQNNFLTEAKQKLNSVKNTAGTTKNVPLKPNKGNGVVSSFITVYEQSTSPLSKKTPSSSPPPNVISQYVTKSASSPPVKSMSPTLTKVTSQLPNRTPSPERTEIYSLLSSAAPSTPSLKIIPQSLRKDTMPSLTKNKTPLQIQRNKDIQSPTKTESSIENELMLITSRLTKKRNPPKPPRHHYTETKYEDSETKLISVIKQNLKEFDDVPSVKPELKVQKVTDQEPTTVDTDNDRNKRNIYSPQLSPEIRFCNVERSYNDIGSFNDKKIKRKVLKKKVSFHDEPSYIPEVTIPKKEEDNKIQNFVSSLNTELTSASEALIAAKKVNLSPREKFVPVKQIKVYPSKDASPPQTPQRLSTKLLDKFQQKPLIAPSPPPSPSPPPPQNNVLSKPSSPSTSQSSSPPLSSLNSTQPLVHLTKTRPRKPPSLKKTYQITMPTAAAQPDWRIRALPKKSIFA